MGENQPKKKKDKKIEILISKNKNIIFTNHFVEYEKNKIYYEDIKGISYLATKNSINGIPSGSSYKLTIFSAEKEIYLKLKSNLFGGADSKDIWSKIVYFLDAFIAPIIAEKLAREIFHKGKIINIGGVKIDDKGYSYKNIFGKTKEAFWKEGICEPQFYQGEVILYRKKNGEPRILKAINMDEDNAVVLPHFLEICVAFSYYKNKENEKKKKK